MEQSAFINEVTQEGYAEPVIVTREANGSIGDHSHPFTAKALILEGEIRIVVKDVSTIYRPGDLFQLDIDTLHQEYYGPQGVTYLVGRRA
jgi:quercetin dioxygenase-like cupin family protein